MLEARSVAVVGASARPDSFGLTMMVQLVEGGFDGAVYPVNPRYEEVMGHACLPSLAEVPEPVDLAILGVANAMLEEQLRAAAAMGARSAVIFASCYEAPVDRAPSLGERLAAIARDAGMSLCGGNGMGFINLDRRLRACGFSEPLDREPGGIAFITHSGSAFSALLHNDRGLRFNVAISSGLELVTTTADYLAHALELDTTRVAALFIETVRDPGGFRRALDRAAERDVPVVALKVGRTAGAQEMVTAHSGALAGEDGAFEALVDAHGVLRVRTLDELADTLELFSAGRRAGPGGLAAIHDSGGERAHLIDVADEVGVPLARISEDTTARLAAVLEEGLPAVNPLDAWGTGNDAADIFIACMHALLEDPDTAALAFCVDLTTELVSESGYARVAAEVFARTGKPVAVLSNLASAIDPRDAGFVRRAGIPVLEGTETGLRALGHLLAYRDHRTRTPAASRARRDPALRDRWRARMAEERSWDEADGLALLRDYGIPVVGHDVVETVEGAVAVAERLGWPVVLKTAAPGVTHKSEVDGIRLGLTDAGAVRRAFSDLATRLGPRMMVQSTAPEGVEMALGVVRDEQFGPLVLVAAGGILVEVVGDRRLALPPLDEDRARAMIDRLAVRSVLDGARGRPRSDIRALCAAIVSMAALAEDLGEQLDAMDVNPLVVSPNGCLAADALVIPRKPAG